MQVRSERQGADAAAVRRRAGRDARARAPDPARGAVAAARDPAPARAAEGGAALAAARRHVGGGRVAFQRGAVALVDDHLRELDVLRELFHVEMLAAEVVARVYVSSAQVRVQA